MSLINDALKRASQSQKERAAAPPPSPAPSTPPLQPVEDTRSAGPSPLLLPLVVVVVLGLAGLAFWKWWQTTQPTTAAAAVSSGSTVPGVASATPGSSEAGSPTATHHLNSPSDIQVNTNPVVRPAPPVEHAAAAPTPTPTPAPAPTTTAVQAPAPAAVTPSAAPTGNTNVVAVAADTPPPKPQFPELKLQGIFYRLRNPSVMINNQTLYKGDDVEGAKVMEIERQSVTVEFHGEKRVLGIH